MRQRLLKALAAVAICLVLSPALYGVGLLSTQVLGYLQYGVWVPLPASYLFREPPLPAVDLALITLVQASGSDPHEVARTNPQVSDALEHLRFYRLIYDLVPTFMRSEHSWYAAPHSWFGLHSLVSHGLEFLSLPGLFMILGVVLANASGPLVSALPE